MQQGGWREGALRHPVIHPNCIAMWGLNSIMEAKTGVEEALHTALKNVPQALGS